MRTRSYLYKGTRETHRVEHSASVDLPRPAEAVWAFMVPAASNTLLSDDTELGVSLPGPSESIGEIQVVVNRVDGQRQAIAFVVVELEPARRASTRTLTSPYPAGGTLTLEPLGDDSCRLTQQFWVDLPPGTPVDSVREIETGYRRELDNLMTRLSALAADGTI